MSVRWPTGATARHRTRRTKEESALTKAFQAESFVLLASGWTLDSATFHESHSSLLEPQNRRQPSREPRPVASETFLWLLCAKIVAQVNGMYVFSAYAQVYLDGWGRGGVAHNARHGAENKHPSPSTKTIGGWFVGSTSQGRTQKHQAFASWPPSR